MAFGEIRKVGFDTETSGTDVKKDRIVTAAVVFTGGGKPDRTLTWLINPGIEIPTAASDIHGVTTEKAREEGIAPEKALEEIAIELGAALVQGIPIVAFNLAFDWSILANELLRNFLLVEYDFIFKRDAAFLVDPLVIDKAMHKYRKGKRQLGIMAEYYGVKIDNWHDATADAIAAVGIAEALFRKYPLLGKVHPEHLYKMQKHWRKIQSKGLQEYFRKEQNDDTIIVEEGWPLIE